MSTPKPIDGNYVQDNLTVTGDITVGGDLDMTGSLSLADGTAAAPSLRFTNDPDSGMYLHGVDELGYTTNGTKRQKLDSVGIDQVGVLTAEDGTDSAPAFSFTSDTTSGLFLAADGEPALVSKTVTLIAGDGNNSIVDIPDGVLTTFSDTTEATDVENASVVLQGGLAVTLDSQVGGSLYLPTSGGTAAGLDFYEEYTVSADSWFQDGTTNEFFSAAKNSDWALTRIGNICTLTIESTGSGATTSAAKAELDTVLPSRFRPSSSTYTTVLVRENNVNQTGVLSVGADGRIIVALEGYADWAGAGSSAIYGTTVSWTL